MYAWLRSPEQHTSESFFRRLVHILTAILLMLIGVGNLRAGVTRPALSVEHPAVNDCGELINEYLNEYLNA